MTEVTEQVTETAGEEVTEQAPVTPPAEPARAGGNVRTRVIGAVVAMALAAAGTAAVLEWRQASALQQEKDVRIEVAAAANRFGTALLSYDHRNLQAARDRVLGLAGADFAKTYDEAFTGGLEGVITKLNASAVATCREVYVGEVDEGTASAIVVCDALVTSDSGTRRMLDTYLKESLSLKKGRWLVDEVSAIGGDEVMTDKNGQVVPSATASPGTGDGQ
ncbi:hypothetical protein J5X84_04485 [Streptosporangiaceae bacterium NEAU-GS5]|nr:hypothetical protein [Streptosporangiaceae bacterium NEAU-GS5]